MLSSQGYAWNTDMWGKGTAAAQKVYKTPHIGALELSGV